MKFFENLHIPKFVILNEVKNPESAWILRLWHRMTYMVNRNLSGIGIIIFVFFLAFSSASAQWALMKSDADSIARRGINHIYNLEFDSASADFNKVKSIYPAHPVGYFLDAMTSWWKITVDTRSALNDNEFLERVGKTVEVCDKLLVENELDIVALFFKGGAIGFRGQYYATHNEYVKAASDGKEALDIVLKCWDISPGNKDILMGVGIYHYYAAALPEQYPLLKPIMLFLPPGDKRGGLAELELAAKDAKYASSESKAILMRIYYQEKDITKAFFYSRELFEKYPKNSVFHKYFGRCLVVLGNSEMEQTWREILNRCIDKKNGYDYNTAREAMYYIGTCLMNRRQFDDALKYFYKCDEFSGKLDEKPSGYMILLNLKVGQIYDLQGKRDLAIKQYQKVLSWEDYQNSRATAENGIAKPFQF